MEFNAVIIILSYIQGNFKASTVTESCVRLFYCYLLIILSIPSWSGPHIIIIINTKIIFLICKTVLGTGRDWVIHVPIHGLLYLMVSVDRMGLEETGTGISYSPYHSVCLSYSKHLGFFCFWSEYTLR